MVPGRTHPLATRAFLLVGLLGCQAEDDPPLEDDDRYEFRSEDASPEEEPAKLASHCGGSLEQPVVELSWLEIAEDDITLPEAQALTVRFENLADEPVRLRDVRVVGDAGGRAISVDYDEIALIPGERASRPLTFSELGIVPQEMKVAGTIVVEAKLSRADGSTLGRASSTALYFHPESATGKFAVYGELALRSEHRGGDFLATASAPNPRRRRLMQGSFELPGGVE